MSSATPPVDSRDPRFGQAIDAYWRSNLRIMAALLAVWALAGLGCGVLLADTLSVFEIGGIPLGFWFAQQGSILVFVVLILVYCILMNRLDRRHHDDMERIRGDLRSAGEGAGR